MHRINLIPSTIISPPEPIFKVLRRLSNTARRTPFISDRWEICVANSSIWRSKPGAFSMSWIAWMADIYAYQNGVLNQEMMTRLRPLNLLTSAASMGISKSIFLEATLVNSREKHNVICWCLIWRTKTDHPGCLCIFPPFDVAKGRFPKTFCSTGGTIGPKEFVAANNVPVRCFRPSFGFVVATTVLPYELPNFNCISLYT
jgi:hypothetical protein